MTIELFILLFFIAFILIRSMVLLFNIVTWPFLSNHAANSHARISVLIPARNEEINLPHIISDLLNQSVLLHEIIVYNDDSTDNTEACIRDIALLHPQVKLIQGLDLPKGWLGKNHACHQLASMASGEYFIFLDADVRLAPGFVALAIDYSVKNNLGLLSFFPKQSLVSMGEWLIVPIMNIILLSMLPLRLVQWSGWKSFSAANGQCMLFNASIYRSLSPHQTFALEPVEDIAIMRFFKSQSIRTAVLLGDENIRCRMYNSHHEALQGFSKNFLHFFMKSYLFAFFFAFSSIIPLVLIPLHFNNYILFSYSIVLLVNAILIALLSKQNIFRFTISFLFHSFYIFLLSWKYFQKQYHKELIWKNRNVYSN